MLLERLFPNSLIFFPSVGLSLSILECVELRCVGDHETTALEKITNSAAPVANPQIHNRKLKNTDVTVTGLWTAITDVQRRRFPHTPRV